MPFSPPLYFIHFIFCLVSGLFRTTMSRGGVLFSCKIFRRIFKCVPDKKNSTAVVGLRLSTIGFQAQRAQHKTPPSLHASFLHRQQHHTWRTMCKWFLLYICCPFGVLNYIIWAFLCRGTCPSQTFRDFDLPVYVALNCKGRMTPIIVHRKQLISKCSQLIDRFRSKTWAEAKTMNFALTPFIDRETWSTPSFQRCPAVISADML